MSKGATHQERVQCTACGRAGAQADPFFYRWEDHEFVIHRCPSCSHQFVHPLLSAAEQARIFNDHYFSENGDWVCGIFGSSYRDAEQKLREEAREILSLVPIRQGRLLDVGCAGGVFLDEARLAGFSVAGIELNATQAQYARDNFGLDVLTARIEDIAIKSWDSVFEVVTLLDCLEHLPQPLEAVRKIAQWTAPGGYLLIRGPLSNSWMSRFKEAARRVARIRKQLPGYPLDANTFSKRSLLHMLDLAGFRLERWIGTTSRFSNLLVRRRTT